MREGADRWSARTQRAIVRALAWSVFVVCMACYPGSCCLAPSTSPSYSCANPPTCSELRCGTGEVCVVRGCGGGAACVACGGAGQACCGTSCGAGAVCEGGTCTLCGGRGQPCCGGNACGAGTLCFGADGGRRCFACGGERQPCCLGAQCGRGFACRTGANEYVCVRSAGADAGPDVAPIPPGFGCRTAADCGGAGAMCLTTFPGGICTRACAVDRECGSSAICHQGVCLAACTQGGGECLDFQADCALLDASNPDRRACVPGCFERHRTPAGTPACVEELPCNPYTGACSGTPVDTRLAENGGPCVVDADCRGGRCLAEVDERGAPTGYLGGYCHSFGRLAPAEEYSMGGDIPRSNCPDGSGVIPFANTMPGDRTACLRLCAANSDCRAGYTCDRLQNRMGEPFFRDGVCLPVNCARAGVPCPAGYRCDVPNADASAPRGTCVRDGDAGVPGDAARD